MSKAKIDLRGPDGNAFALLGMAKNFSKQLDHSPEYREQIQAEMTEYDYDHLVDTFKQYFGDYVTIEGDSRDD